MRLLVLNWQDGENPRAGGAETHLHEVFGRIADAGVRVTLICSGWKGAPRGSSADGIEIVRAGGRHSYPLAGSRTAYRYLARNRVDLVIEDLNKTPLFTPLWSSVKTALLVHHLFGATAFRSATAPVAAATWMLERPIPAVYRRVPVQAVSDSTRNDLVRRGLHPDRIRVVPNGIDTAFFTPDPSGGREMVPTFLVLGRLQGYKRPDLPLRGIARLAARGIECRMWVAGTGSALPALRRLRDRLDLGKRVEFLGYVSEERKRELLRRAWAHVFTSPKEGWGLTNLEAGACGTPTIASDSPGLRDSVRHEKTGLLLPHGNLSALAGAMERIATDPALRERLSRGARAFAETHTWDATAAAALEHFTEIVRSGAAR